MRPYLASTSMACLLFGAACFAYPGEDAADCMASASTENVSKQLQAARSTPLKLRKFEDLASATCEELETTLDDLNAPAPGRSYDVHEITTWVYSYSEIPRGVVVLVHGLNLRPSRMDELALELRADGFHVLRVSLSGHRGDPDEMNHVSRFQWLRDVFLSYCVAKASAKERNLPIDLVGFSLGGLVAQDLLNQEIREKVHFERAALFAPAISVLGAMRMVKALNIFGEDFSLGSRSPPAYRANPGTTMAAYNALFDSLDAVSKSGFGKSNIPTAVFVDPKDELVSADGLKGLIAERKLTNWSLIEVSTRDGKVTPNYHHLIIDEDAVGVEQWRAIREQLRGHLIPGSP